MARLKTNDKLPAELRAAGASRQEAEELGRIAVSLIRLKGREPVVSVKVRHRYRLPLKLSLAITGGLLLGGLVVAAAQTVYPGNWLYPVKRVSENLAVAIRPDYRGVVMMRRAQEVKELVASHSDPSLVATTLQDYRLEAAAYKTKNYAAFEYCKANLVQAEALASVSEKPLIASAIAGINVDD